MPILLYSVLTTGLYGITTGVTIALILILFEILKQIWWDIETRDLLTIQFTPKELQQFIYDNRENAYFCLDWFLTRMDQSDLDYFQEWEDDEDKENKDL